MLWCVVAYKKVLLFGLTDKDLRRICRNQYGHLGLAIGYWPYMCLGHVCIVLEPVGSAHLTFVDDIVLYELYVFSDRMLFGVLDEITDMTRNPEWSGDKVWYMG